ncbi:hypothetical protein OAG24_00060 [bacterium]|nr:hypothetical protein [bacterium]
MLLAFLVILLVIIIIVLVVVYVVLWHRDDPDSYWSVTTDLIDTNIQKVNISTPSEFELNKNESTFFPMYKDDHIIGVGQSADGGSYNYNWKFSDTSQLKVYFTSGGIKPANQYVKSMRVLNGNRSSDMSLYSQDMNGKEYEIVRIKRLYSVNVPIWIGQKVGAISSGELVPVPEGTTQIKITNSATIEFT